MQLLYHASPVGGIETLEPRVSNHGDPRVYFSQKRENTLVYLSNAVEKFCIETNYPYNGPWPKWGPYGFTADRIFQFQEYYPDALKETYKGVSAFIYTAIADENIQPLEKIPEAFYSYDPVQVISCEPIDDAYAELMKAYENGKIGIARYERWTDEQLEKIRAMIRSEYMDPDIHPAYKYFLEHKFPWLSTSSGTI